MRKGKNGRPLSVASRPPSLISDTSSSSRPSSMDSDQMDGSLPMFAFPSGTSSPLKHQPHRDESLKRPKHLLMRSRRTSMPAVPTLTQSFPWVSAPRPPLNRLSTTSIASFNSLPENEEQHYFSPALHASPNERLPLSASSSTSDTSHLLLPDPSRRPQVKHRSRKHSMKRTRSEARSFLTPEEVAQQNRQSHKRSLLIQELVDTEQAYVEVLTAIETQYLEPLLGQQSPILERRAIAEIFSNFSDVIVLNREILRRLIHGTGSSFAPRASSSSSPPLNSLPAAVTTDQPGTLLLPLCPFLKCYSMFIQNFSVSLQRIDTEDRHNDKWRKFTNERKEAGTGQGLNLSSMLLGIVQRIPRYRMLLTGILKTTPKEHEDHRDLARACAIVETVADSVNDAVRQHEESQRLLELQSNFLNLDSPLLAPGRRLLKSGSLLKTCRRDEEMRHFFLFSDVLIYGSALEQPTGWKRSMSMTGIASAITTAEKRMSVCTNLSAPAMSRSSSSRSNSGPPSGLEQQYQLHGRMPLKDLTIISADGLYFELRGTERSFAVAADTPEAKAEWMNALRTAKAELLEKRQTLNTETMRQPRKRAHSLPRLPLSPLSQFSPEPVPSPIQEETSSLVSTPLATPSPSLSSNSFARTPFILSPVQILSPGRLPTFVEEPAEIPVAHDYSAPIWIPDSKAARCMGCQESFGLWRRKHHCRLCGQVVCWSCSTNTFMIPAASPSQDDQIARACDACFSSCFKSPPPTESPTRPATDASPTPTLELINSVLKANQ